MGPWALTAYVHVEDGLLVALHNLSAQSHRKAYIKFQLAVAVVVGVAWGNINKETIDRSMAKSLYVQCQDPRSSARESCLANPNAANHVHLHQVYAYR